MAAGTDALRDRMTAILHADSLVMAALRAARDMALPEGWIVAGALYQTVWNALGGLPPGTGIRDIDLIYHDASDLSWEAEDAVIRRAAIWCADMPVPVEVRNQARVHLWFEDRFGLETTAGRAFAPLTSSLESLTRYAAIAHAVAARLGPDDLVEIAAPFGLSDVFDRVLRPNPGADRNRAAFVAKAERMRATWPDLRIVLD